jgi:Rad3-related DNA helicase
MMKVPYPSLGDKRTKRMMQRNQTWYNWKTAKTIIQTVGRGVRNKDDWCKNYFLDDAWHGFYSRSKRLFPETFKDTIIEVDDYMV